MSAAILTEVAQEREKQIAKWGVQHRPSFEIDHSARSAASIRDTLRKRCDALEKKGPSPGFTGGADWMSILQEETWEAYAETKDRAKLRHELIQSAAVIVAWIEDLDAHK